MIKMQFNEYNKNMWHDSSIEKIVIEYNEITVELDTYIGVKKIRFINYISFDYIGQWDENIIECIYEEGDNDVIKNALNKVNKNNNTKYKGGGTRDINSNWKCIIIKLIDDVCIRIVCNDVICDGS